MRQARRIFLAVLVGLIVATAGVQASAPAPSLLRQGMSGDDVYRVQAKLLEFGYYQNTPDGMFGPATREAVLAFQMDEGLAADGVVGPATLAALRDYRPPAGRALGESRAGRQVAAFARQFVGVPYVWAGRSPSGFDCSGFAAYVYSQFGVELPRMADGQFDTGATVGRRELIPGDLVFFSTYEPGPSHVGIYIGGGAFVHASSSAGEVTVTPLVRPYYAERYLGARRILR